MACDLFMMCSSSFSLAACVTGSASPPWYRLTIRVRVADASRGSESTARELDVERVGPLGRVGVCLSRDGPESPGWAGAAVDVEGVEDVALQAAGVSTCIQRGRFLGVGTRCKTNCIDWFGVAACELIEMSGDDPHDRESTSV